ncbi:unnamed protein product [Ectocarpus sp. CCAP 1310/34]|nr:unnamed protein product [Ectocarpus sp. CCAP 1310/34]
MAGVGLVRLGKELKMLTDEPPPGVCAWPVDDCITHLQAQIQGPEDTPYERGTFLLELKIPDRYPFEPPKVRFVTPIYHPNIDSGGRICLDTLKMRPAGSWAPSMNVPTLLTTIRLLMAHPNGDDGLMPDITELFLKNPSRFADVARAHVEEHARQDKPSPASSKAAPPTQRQTAEDTAAAPRDGGGKAGKTSVPSIATTSRDYGRPSAVGDKLGSLSPDKNSRSKENSVAPAAAAAGNDEVGKVTSGGVRSPPSPTGGDGNGTAEASSAADGDGSDDSDAGKGKGPAAAAQKPPDDADDCSSNTRKDSSVENGGRAEHDGDGASSDDGAWSDSEDDDDDEDGGGMSNKRARTVM